MEKNPMKTHYVMEEEFYLLLKVQDILVILKMITSKMDLEDIYIIMEINI
jgi:hypothetical protein